jgi:hypothetical protein
MQQCNKGMQIHICDLLGLPHVIRLCLIKHTAATLSCGLVSTRLRGATLPSPPTLRTQPQDPCLMLTLWCRALYMGGTCWMSPVSFWAASTSCSSAQPSSTSRGSGGGTGTQQ